MFHQLSFMDRMALISNEAEDVSGRTSAEIERVFYLRVNNFDFLERAASAERQEQWSVKVPKTDENAGSGSIRVRKIVNLRQPGTAVQYVLTSKLDIGAKGSSAETSEISSLDQFNVFKHLANKGMLKDRYTYPIDGSDLSWEIDCFPKPGTQYYEWVKVDLEHWPKGTPLPAWPCEFSEMLEGNTAEQSDEVKQKISQMYEEGFLLKNEAHDLGQRASEQPGVAESSVSGKTDDDGQGQNTGAPNAEGGTPPADGAVPPEGGKEGDQKPADGAEGGKKPEGDDLDGDQGAQDDEATRAAAELGKATTEAFSSISQTLLPFVPILGPLVTVAYGNRGAKVFMESRQHTSKTISKVDGQGRRNDNVQKGSSYALSDLADAKDYIGLIEDACRDIKLNKSKIDSIDMTLWPQKDGKFGVMEVSTNRQGETKIFTENNPGKLQWFSTSLAGKRIIRLRGDEVAKFNFNNRTIICPFEGKIIEFDVGQLRAIKYSTVPNSRHEFEIIEHNFDV